MEKRFSWKAFVQYALDEFDYKTFIDFVIDMRDSIDWVSECDGRTEEDILGNTSYVMFDDWFE